MGSIRLEAYGMGAGGLSEADLGGIAPPAVFVYSIGLEVSYLGWVCDVTRGIKQARA